MDTDKRSEIRVPLELPIEYRAVGDETYYSLTEDLSTHGVCIRSKDSFGVGTQCHLSFALSPHQEKTEMIGEVRWLSSEPAQGKMGIQLAEPIDFSVPFAATEHAVRLWRQQTEAYSDRAYQALSDACVWVNSSGEIIQYDERFLSLLGYPEGEVKGRPFHEFAHDEDQERLTHLLTSSIPHLTSGFFRMLSKEGQVIFWKIRVPPKLPWTTSREIYIEHLTEFRALREQKHQLEQIVGIVRRSVSDRVVLLNSDLSIANIGGVEITPQVSFKGMDLRKATGLVEAKVNEKKLWDELKLCVKTGQEFASDLCHYQGREDDSPDLFPPGTFRIRISPITDLNQRVTSLLMVVKSEAPPGIYRGKEVQDLYHFRHILGAAATGFIIKDILKEVCNPLTYLLASLGLLSYKLALERKKMQVADSEGFAFYPEEIKKIEELIEDLTKKFRYMIENTYLPEPVKTYDFDINECLSRAITIVTMYEEFDGESIEFNPQPRLPKARSDEQEIIMMFLVFLMLSRDCVRTVSDKTLRCETRENQDHIIASISHNGYIQESRYLDILFDNNPLQSYFSKSHSIYFMDTLLYYGNLLMKKNNVKIKINNVPGEFSLSLFIPREKSASQSD